MTSFQQPPQPPQPVAEYTLQRILSFRTRLYLTWAAMLGCSPVSFLSFDLKFSIILDKLPNLVACAWRPTASCKVRR